MIQRFFHYYSDFHYERGSKKEEEKIMIFVKEKFKLCMPKECDFKMCVVCLHSYLEYSMYMSVVAF